MLRCCRAGMPRRMNWNNECFSRSRSESVRHRTIPSGRQCQKTEHGRNSICFIEMIVLTCFTAHEPRASFCLKNTPYRDGLSSNLFNPQPHVYVILQHKPNNLIVPHIIQQPHLPGPLLLHNRPNLLRRQHKPNSTLCVRGTQFERPAVIRPAHSMVVVPRIACREV